MNQRSTDSTLLIFAAQHLTAMYHVVSDGSGTIARGWGVGCYVNPSDAIERRNSMPPWWGATIAVSL